MDIFKISNNYYVFEESKPICVSIFSKKRLLDLIKIKVINIKERNIFSANRLTHT